MRHGWLTTLRTDGSPRTSRVWFVELGDAIWIATSESARKIGDLRRDPRASFAVEGEHGAVAVTGTVEATGSAPEVLAAFRQQYDGWNAADPMDYGPRVLIRLRPRKQ
jgi:PPOX class probable F420-dependent enzyme